MQSSNIRPHESDSDSDAPLLRRVYNRLILQIYTILPQRAHPLWMLNSTLNFSVSHQLAGMKSCPRSSLRALDEQHGTIRPALPLMKTTRTRLELATSESERRWPPNKHAENLKKGRFDTDASSLNAGKNQQIARLTKELGESCQRPEGHGFAQPTPTLLYYAKRRCQPPLLAPRKSDTHSRLPNFP